MWWAEAGTERREAEIVISPLSSHSVPQKNSFEFFLADSYDSLFLSFFSFFSFFWLVETGFLCIIALAVLEFTL